MSNDQNSGGVMRRWTTRLWVAAILCISFYGCVPKTSHIIIAYHGQENVNRIEEAGSVAIKVKVVDLRIEKEVGNIPVLHRINANNNLRELIAHAFETELTHRGFKSGEGVLIEVDLIKFYTVFGTVKATSGIGVGRRYTSNMILHVDVKKPDGTLIYSNLIRGKGAINAHPFLFHPSKASLEHDTKVALDAALKDGIYQLVNDPEFIKSLLKASAN